MQDRASVRCNTDSPFEFCGQRNRPGSQRSVMVGDRKTRFENRKPFTHRRNDDSLVLNKGKSGEWALYDLRRTAATMVQARAQIPT